MRRFSTVKVSGSSMAPTFMPGDWLLVKSLGSNSHPIKINQIYLVNDPERPGIKLLKRVKDIEVNQVAGDKFEHKYWVEGDHPASIDSRKWGWLDESEVISRVVIRYRKGKN